jgi:cyclomaltodextrinase / maltogenic alpha-amylase / neopullulanase
MSVPDWVQDAIFYQIFPDRFANGDPENDPPYVQVWGTHPDLWGFQGGDLRGIISRLDYLTDLGVNALYLNPIFLSPSTHRYNTTDYYRIDPKLGSKQDLSELIQQAHARGMRILLDGVFNHCGRGFFAFSDLLENQEHSNYRDWFHVKKFPIDAYSPGEARDYLAWWQIKSLPKFNTDSPEVRHYIFEVARYWMQQGIDGWRLDVPNEIDDDTFWDEFRSVVHSVNPQAYLLGEIWEVDPRWANETHFDGLMDYPLRTAILGWLERSLPPSRFAARVDELLNAYPHPNVYSMLNLVGSHDVERILTLCQGNVDKVKLAYTFIFAIPGAPAVYYGDEVGLEGGKDPDNRRAFPWEPTQWKPGLRETVCQLIAVRKRMPVMRRGGMRSVLTDDQSGVYVFMRTLELETVIVALNASSTRSTVSLPVADLGWEDGRSVSNLLGSELFTVADGHLSLRLEPWSGVWLR